MYFFKYYSPEDYKFLFKPNGISLRFSQPRILNDPFELLFVYDSPSQNTKIKMKEDILEKKGGYKEIENLALSSAKPIKELFENHNNDHQKIDRLIDMLYANIQFLEQDKINNKLNDTFGILSFTPQGYSRPMWSYYGKNHTGFAVEFDPYSLNLPSSNNENTVIKGVEYENERPKNLHPSEGLDPIFEALYTKDDEWTHEDEWRLVYPLKCIPITGSDPTGAPLHTHILNSKHVHKVLLGALSSKATEEEITKWIKDHAPHVKLHKLSLSKINYQLDYTEIEI